MSNFRYVVEHITLDVLVFAEGEPCGVGVGVVETPPGPGVPPEVVKCVAQRQPQYSLLVIGIRVMPWIDCTVERLVLAR